jgi:hypothetical protein
MIPEEPISRGEAAAGFVALGVASAAASVTLSTLLDETGRCPGDNDMSVKAFSLRALVPLSLGILPSVVGWWASDSSTSPPVDVTAQVEAGNRTLALSLFARF